MAWRTAALAVALFLHPLQETYGRANKIKTFAKLVLEEPFVAKVQALGLISENDKCRRRRCRLGHIVNFHLARCWRSPAIKINFREPAIQFTGGDAPAARVGHSIDQVEKFFRAIARERGHEYNGRVVEKLESRAHKFFVIDEQLSGVDFSR